MTLRRWKNVHRLYKNIRTFYYKEFEHIQIFASLNGTKANLLQIMGEELGLNKSKNDDLFYHSPCVQMFANPINKECMEFGVSF